MKKAEAICKCCKRFITREQKKTAKRIKKRSERRFFKSLLKKEKYDLLPNGIVNKKNVLKRVYSIKGGVIRVRRG